MKENNISGITEEITQLFWDHTTNTLAIRFRDNSAYRIYFNGGRINKYVGIRRVGYVIRNDDLKANVTSGQRKIPIRNLELFIKKLRTGTRTTHRIMWG